MLSTQPLRLWLPILGLLLLVVLPPASSSVQVAPSVSSFTFAFAGDFSHYQRFQANMDSLNQSGAAFFLAVGDLAYGPNVTTVEQNWCSQFKASFDNVEIITGNHDSGENTYGSIQKYVQYCPWTLPGITIVPGVRPGYGYGYEYYFDYPAVNSLARFIMISPGINFTAAQAGFSEVWKYNVRDQHYNWTSDTIDSARAAGIPWVIVGMHKPCLVVATDSTCSSGASIMNLLLSKQVDLVINGHMHMYTRSKQLSCATYGLFSPGCVVDDRNLLAKGAGTVMVTSGTGGQSPLDNIDPAKTENVKYFEAENNDTTGYSEVKVSTESLQMQFVPTTGAFTDSFMIQQPTSDFSLSVPPSLDISTDENVQYPAHIMVAGWNGFAGSVTLSSSIMPSAGLGVDCNPVTVGLNAGLPIAYSACAIHASNAGSYVVNITGTSGPSSHSAMMTVTAESSRPDFTISASTFVSFNANTSYTSAIRVQSKNFLISPIQLSSAVTPSTGLNVSLSANTLLYGSGISIATFTGSTPRTYTVTISATSGTITHLAGMIVQVTRIGVGGDYAEAVVPALIVVQPIQNQTSTVHIVSLNGFRGNVSLSALVIDNCIPGPCFNGPFAPRAFLDRTRVSLAGGTTAQSTMAIQAPSIPYSKPVNFSVEIVVSNGTIFHSVGLTVSVEPNPDFTIATTPALVTFFFGEMGTAIFTVVGQYGFTGTVNLAVLVAPSTGLDATCAPSIIRNGSGSSSCIFSSSSPGSYGLTATGTSGETTHSASAIVIVGKRNTSTSVLCSPSTVAINQDSTCIATVSDVSPGSASTPTGTVSFSSTGAVGFFGATNCTLVIGSCTVMFLPGGTGTTTFNGSYSGDATHTTSSGSGSITINRRTTTTVIACLPTTLVIDNNTTCVATVTDMPTGMLIVPTGTVNWTLGGTGAFNAINCTLSGGRCSVTYTPTAVGTGSHLITGTYNPDSTHYGSFSAVDISVQDFSLFVNPAELSFAAGSSGSVFATLGGLNGFQGQVLIAIDSPVGVSCIAGSTSLTVSAPVVLTCRSTSPGTYVVIVNGTYGSASHSAELTLAVSPPYRSPPSSYEQNLLLPLIVSGTIGGLVLVGIFLAVAQRAGKKTASTSTLVNS